MPLYHPYALVLGLVLGFAVIVGAVARWRSLILVSMVLAAVTASPVTSFTRGGAGAIYASDIVSIALLLCLALGLTRPLFFHVAPAWYYKFFWWMIVASVSVLLVAPLFTVNLELTEFGQRVRSPLPGIPLWLAMAGFRIVRTVLYWVYFAFAAHLVMDAKTLRITARAIVVGITALAVCEIITFFNIADMAFYIPFAKHQAGHILGHPKAAAGRLYVAGLFVCVMLLYRSIGSPIYFAAIATMGAGVFFSGSRAALVGVAAGVAVLAVRARLGGKIVVVLLIVAAVVAVPYLANINPERAQQFAHITEDPSENPRWTIWSWVLEYLVEQPHIIVTGVGFTNFFYALQPRGAIAEHAHNDVLTCLVELGIIGLFAFVLYMVALVRELLRKVKHSAGRERWEALCLTAVFAGFLITGLFEQTFYYSPGAMCMQRVLAVLFGTYTAYWVQQAHLAQVSVEPQEAFPHLGGGRSGLVTRTHWRSGSSSPPERLRLD